MKNGNHSDLVTVVETITPEVARQYLLRNSGNRRLRPAVVAFYSAEMAAGRWRLHHQGIAFAPDGRLLDGQHRLQAVIDSNVVVSMAVSWNVDPSTFTLIDHGRKRDAGDALELSVGVGAPQYVAGVVRAAIARNRSMGGLAAMKLHDDHIVSFYREHRGVIDQMIGAWGVRTAAAVTACAVACVLDGMGAAEDVAAIGRRFYQHDFDGKDDPLNRLRQFLDNRSRLSGDEKYRYAVTAINAALRQRQLGVLQPSTRDWLENPGTSGRSRPVAEA